VDASEWLDAARQAVSELHDQYASLGLATEFEEHVALLRTTGQWPFGEWPQRGHDGRA
jgi:hypothetical protein